MFFSVSLPGLMRVVCLLPHSFETQYGTEESAQAVLDKARAYVQKLAGGTNVAPMEDDE